MQTSGMLPHQNILFQKMKIEGSICFLLCVSLGMTNLLNYQSHLRERKSIQEQKVSNVKDLKVMIMWLPKEYSFQEKQRKTTKKLSKKPLLQQKI